jgi:uncharacterized protein YuzE
MALKTESVWQLDYDARGDVLYASLGAPQPALSYEIEPDVLLNYVPPHPQVVGITVLNCLRHFPRRDMTPIDSHAATVVEEVYRKYPRVPLP